MTVHVDRHTLTRRHMAVALCAAALATALGGSDAVAQSRDRPRDRDRTPVCDLMQDDCLMQQLQQRDRERLRQCDPSRQDCAALRRELRIQVEDRWARGQRGGFR